MSASAHTLARIAATLGMPVEAFTQPGPATASDLIAQLAADPDGARLAAAFLSIRQPTARAGLAATMERIAAVLADDAPDELTPEPVAA